MPSFVPKFFCCELCDQYLSRNKAQSTEDGYLICDYCAESDLVTREYHGDECYLYVEES
jgi:hypothetical protein